MSYTFDGVNKIISLSLGTVSLDLIDLHSRWKDWVLSGNAGFSPAFLTIGGDIPAIPLYLFLLNGWRIRPQEANHTLTVINGILEVEGGVGDPFIDTIGTYKIRINRETPGIAIGYSSNGSDPSSIASAVWNHVSATTLLADVTFLKDIEGGRWKILNNQMIFYKADNVTEVARYNLKDASGNPTMDGPVERERV